MLFTLTYEGTCATDLGYLLHKNPSRVQEFSLPFGKVHLFYPDVSEERCTCALLLEIDPIQLSRGKGKRQQQLPLEPYVNDRPYVASSYFTVALSKVLSSALNGKCKERPELVERPLSLTVQLSMVKSKGGEQILKKLWEPLGYDIELERLPLDSLFPEWGESPYFRLTLRHQIRLYELLSHLYVLLPVLDNEKHYFVSEQEIEKLRKYGEGWLADHPAKELIIGRYLKYKRKLADEVLEELASSEWRDRENLEENLEKPLRLHDLRQQIVVQKLKDLGVRSVLDLGCGSGKLLQKLHTEPSFSRIVGADVSLRALEIAQKKLEKWKDNRIEIFQGSLLYQDERFRGLEATVLVEVIEHMELDRLKILEQQLFQYIRSPFVILTTPNREYNQLFEGLPSGKFRHTDHRFEWTRKEFQDWGNRVANEYGYQVTYEPLGEEHPEFGAPSQMAVFRLLEKEGNIR